MHQRDARRTRHHTPVTLMSRRLHDTFEQSTHTHDQEPIDDYHTILSDKCNDRHKACRPHLSHNVFDRYPHKRELQRARIRPTWKQRHTSQLHREGGRRHTAKRPHASTITSREQPFPVETGVAGGPHKSNTRERTRGGSLTRFTDAPERCATDTSSPVGYTHQPAVTHTCLGPNRYRLSATTTR